MRSIFALRNRCLDDPALESWSARRPATYSFSICAKSAATWERDVNVPPHHADRKE